MMPATNQMEALEQLRTMYPWPTRHPEVTAVPWNLNGGGRWIVESKIRKNRIRVVLEIGAFLGGSIQTWLNASPDVIVVAVDPWPDDPWVIWFAEQYGDNPILLDQVKQPDGFYHTFLANLWEYRNRVIPVRECSPAILPKLASMGFQPDLIYLDSDKVGGEVDLCHQLFPTAIMTGDDWEWTNKEGVCPIREPVTRHCETHGKHLWVERATWMIDSEPLPLSFRLRSMRRRIKKTIKERLAA